MSQVGEKERRKRAIRGWLFAGVFTLVLLEVGIAILAETKVVFIRTPDYTWSNERQLFGGDINRDFGTWHRSNAEAILSMACFDVHYASNSYGARDKEREKVVNQPRVVVLGDSFVEGFGVEAEERVTDLLEAKTTVPHLNFGTSGVFGSTTSALLYEHLASDFSHDQVVFMILPDNDFIDDDLELGKVLYPDRYRPYWDGTYPDYTLTYFQPEFPEEGATKQLDLPWYRMFLHRYTYTYNMFGYLKKRLQYDAVNSNHQYYSGYYDFKPEQFDRLRYSIERMKQQAETSGAQLSVVTMPVFKDLKRYDIEPRNPLARRLEDLAQEVGFEYFDLLPLMHENDADWASYYHTCDPHWSAKGHRVAAALMLDHLSIYR